MSGNTAVAKATHFEAIVVGAGFGGLRMLHELRQLGISARVLEAGTDVGGTWYWNRYPGARTDSEAWVYCFGFSRALVDEWEWPERMPSQMDVLRYLQFAADRLDMRKDIQFNTRVKSAVFDEPSNQWTLTTESGGQFTCTYFISASGLLSAAYKPPFPGLDSFEGRWAMTAQWPKEGVDFTGKRVGIVGSGSTAVQLLPVAARTAAHVSMFQRTPNYVLPSRNYALDAADKQAIRTNFKKTWAQCQEQVFAFAMDRTGRAAVDYSPAEQQRIFEAGWETGGFRFLFETFDDLLVNAESNFAAAEFIRNKIRAIVKDPAVAEMLCPNYPFAAKRPPLGNFYFEAFNRDNVTLIDVSNDPIEAITPTGVKTRDREFEFDILVFALGFDAVTGALTQMDVHGKDGATIKDKWEAGVQTYLGIGVDNFPNMFMISGPQGPFANIPVVVDNVSSWIGQAISYMRGNGYNRLEAEPSAVEAWGQHVKDIVDMTLFSKGEAVHSWMLGANIPGKAHSVLFYLAGADSYFKEIKQVSDASFPGFSFGRRAGVKQLEGDTALAGGRA